jgi:hypothetical protein
MRPTVEELRAAYVTGGLRAAIALEMERGCPTPNAARSRIVRFGVHRKRYQRRDWTTLEVATLVRLWNAGTPSAGIAKELGRTEVAVQRRASEHPECRPRFRKPWTRAQERLIEDAVDQIVEHFSARFGRTDGAIRNRIRKAAVTAKVRRRARSIAA